MDQLRVALCPEKLAVRDVTNTLEGFAGYDPQTKAMARHQPPLPS